MSADLPTPLADLGVTSDEWQRIRRNGHRRIHRELSEHGVDRAFAKLREILRKSIDSEGSHPIGARGDERTQEGIAFTASSQVGSSLGPSSSRIDLPPSGCKPNKLDRSSLGDAAGGHSSSTTDMQKRLVALKAALTRTARGVSKPNEDSPPEAAAGKELTQPASLSSRPWCKFWCKGYCAAGSACHFMHPDAAATNELHSRKARANSCEHGFHSSSSEAALDTYQRSGHLGPCRYFVAGVCVRGNACWYSHDPILMGGKSQQRPAVASSSFVGGSLDCDPTRGSDCPVVASCVHQDTTAGLDPYAAPSTVSPKLAPQSPYGERPLCGESLFSGMVGGDPSADRANKRSCSDESTGSYMRDAGKQWLTYFNAQFLAHLRNDKRQCAEADVNALTSDGFSTKRPARVLQRSKTCPDYDNPLHHFFSRPKRARLAY